MTVTSERSSYHAVVSLAGVPTASSPSPVRWSQDGQVVVATSIELNIMVGFPLSLQ